MTFVEMQVKWPVTLTDRFGLEILTVLEIKRQNTACHTILHWKGLCDNPKASPTLHMLQLIYNTFTG